MRPFVKYLSLSVLVGVAVLDLSLPAASAQNVQTQRTRTTTIGNNNTFFRIGGAAPLSPFPTYGGLNGLYGNSYAPLQASFYSPLGQLYGYNGGYGGGYGGCYGGYGGGYGSSPGFGAYGSYGGNTGGYCPYEDPYNGYLTGAAAVINSQANYVVSRSRAQVLREQARQGQIDTQRKLYEEWKYERNDQPALEQLRREAIDQAWRRAVYNPPPNDIWSADALNRILDHASRIVGQGTAGATIPLDDDTVRKINVSTGVPGNAGLLKDKGDRFGQLVEEAVRDAIFNGKVDRGTLDRLHSAQRDLDQRLRALITEVSPNDYTEARRYLQELNQALRVLKRPDAADYLNGKYTAQGKDVGELIKNMSKHGLRFAPAVAGDEAAYNALYRAMVAYDLGLAQKQAERQ
jgi:hypothetical protein